MWFVVDGCRQVSKEGTLLLQKLNKYFDYNHFCYSIQKRIFFSYWCLKSSNMNRMEWNGMAQFDLILEPVRPMQSEIRVNITRLTHELHYSAKKHRITFVIIFSRGSIFARNNAEFKVFIQFINERSIFIEFIELWLAHLNELFFVFIYPILSISESLNQQVRTHYTCDHDIPLCSWNIMTENIKQIQMEQYSVASIFFLNQFIEY